MTAAQWRLRTRLFCECSAQAHLPSSYFRCAQSSRSQFSAQATKASRWRLLFIITSTAVVPLTHAQPQILSLRTIGGNMRRLIFQVFSLGLFILFSSAFIDRFAAEISFSSAR